MKHMLRHPAYPDLVAEWAANDQVADASDFANDNVEEAADWIGDPLLMQLATLEIAATRCW